MKEYEDYATKHLKVETSIRLTKNGYNLLLSLFQFNAIHHYILVDRYRKIIDSNFYFFKFEKNERNRNRHRVINP